MRYSTEASGFHRVARGAGRVANELFAVRDANRAYQASQRRGWNQLGPWELGPVIALGIIGFKAVAPLVVKAASYAIDYGTEHPLKAAGAVAGALAFDIGKFALGPAGGAVWGAEHIGTALGSGIAAEVRDNGQRDIWTGELPTRRGR